jgi:hypothetical protein
MMKRAIEIPQPGNFIHIHLGYHGHLGFLNIDMTFGIRINAVTLKGILATLLQVDKVGRYVDQTPDAAHSWVPSQSWTHTLKMVGCAESKSDL